MKIITLSSLLVVLYSYEVIAVKLPGPLVYVVTPSSKLQIDEARAAQQPFYYHNWISRMDSPVNETTTTSTTPAPKKIMTPDLIFAEFESDKMKNIRKLLEEERIDKTTTTTATTMAPIYVPAEDEQAPHVSFIPHQEDEQIKTKEKDMTDYFALYNNMYNGNYVPPVPVYNPTTTTTATAKPTTTLTTTTPAPIHNVENIWHIIDSQKQDQYTGQWDEVPIGIDNDNKAEQKEEENQLETKQDEPNLDDNFALPGFGTNPGVGGENESRAIRTEPNIRFPYVNLKPFQVKNFKKPVLNVFADSKKGNNNMYTNLDNYVEVKNPVRGEAQDAPVRQPVDRYNPAQPYLPSEYGSKSKQSRPSSAPTKTVANLVPPPPPPPPKVTDNDFPAPSSYEQFPPFTLSGPDSAPPFASAPAVRPPVQPPSMESDDADSAPGDDGPQIDLGYRYKPPSPPSQNFLPTLPPLQKAPGGYSYDKPPMTSYDKPMTPYDTPQAAADNDFQGYNYNRPPVMPETPEFSGYSYKKPEPPVADAPSPSYGHHHDSDYPELIYDKPHAGHGPKGGGDMQGGDDSMGMAPPPMADVKPGPPDNSGFPHDFPVDFKYHHDFDDNDHDFHHYHHHHTTTTTTTEMPRVNRYSYYYLGKKLYYLPLYFSVYFIIYVGALIIKAVLRHKIVYPNSWRPNDQTASFFAKRSVDSPWDSSENLHEITGKVTRAIASAVERYSERKKKY